MLDFQRIISLWNSLSAVPGGKNLFSRAIRFFVPYTGTIGAVVECLRPGYAKARLPDRRIIRNHLKSIHAMALANFGEMVTGLALNTALSKDMRAIVTGFSIEYFKKGRGELVAEATAPADLEKITESTRLEISTVIFDAAQNKIAKVTATWLVGIGKKKRDN